MPRALTRWRRRDPGALYRFRNLHGDGAEKYAPVYRHRSVEFGSFAEEGDKIEQSLTIVDEDNDVWNAIYYLERQPDGTWRTNGCVLTKSTESSL